MSRIVVRDLEGLDELARIAAQDLAGELKRLLALQQSVNLVLTGGTVGIKVLSEMAPLMAKLDADRIQIWWGDERFVEASSPDRNFVQAREALLSKVLIPEDNIHAMPSTEDGDLREAAEAFSAKIDAYAPSFDVVLLGMGGDGHVASLFPGSSPMEIGGWVVAEPNSPKPPQQRISLSYEALASADQVWFLVAGEDKAAAVARVFHGEDLPATKVTGNQQTKWYLDKAAASEITS
jgi:6-phosphogluconolactonase